MISKEVYNLLKAIPQKPYKISFEELVNKNIYNINFVCSNLEDCIKQKYIYCPGHTAGINKDIPHCNFSLQKEGLDAIAEYENAEYNKEISQKSLKISTIGMWAAIISAIAAVGSLVATILIA